MKALALFAIIAWLGASSLKLPPTLNRPVGAAYLGALDAELKTVLDDVEFKRDNPEEWLSVERLRESIKKQELLPTFEPYFAASLGLGSWGPELSLPVARSAFDVLMAKALNYESRGFDPFVELKVGRLGSPEAIAFIESIAVRLMDIIDDEQVRKSLETVLLIALFAEAEDLLAPPSRSPDSANRSPRERRNSFFQSLEARRARLLNGEVGLNELVEALASGDGTGRVDLVPGEPGPSLVGDLLLAHALLTLRCCDSVVMHCPSFPLGLRGSTALDVAGHIAHLADPRKSDLWAVHHLGEALRMHVERGSLRFVEDSFWGMAHVPLDELPSDSALAASFAGSKIVVIKGDHNYRRLLSERDWPLGAQVEEAMRFSAVKPPARVHALRVIKSRICCGLSPSAQQRAMDSDATWLESGWWALVQSTGGERE